MVRTSAGLWSPGKGEQGANKQNTHAHSKKEMKGRKNAGVCRGVTETKRGSREGRTILPRLGFLSQTNHQRKEVERERGRERERSRGRERSREKGGEGSAERAKKRTEKTKHQRSKKGKKGKEGKRRERRGGGRDGQNGSASDHFHTKAPANARVPQHSHGITCVGSCGCRPCCHAQPWLWPEPWAWLWA